MLIFNYQALDVTNPKTDVEKAVKNRLDEIKKSEKVFTLKDPSPRRKSDTGRPQENSPIQFRLNTGEARTWVYKNGNGEPISFTGQWLQSDKSPKIKDGIYDYEPSIIRIVEEQTFNSISDYEKIFFISEIYNPNRVGIVVEDKEQEAKYKNELRKLRSTVEYAIFSDNKLEIGDIRNLAYSWGVNADGLSLEEIKDELFKAVERSEKDRANTWRGFNEFIEDSQSMGKDVKIRSYIQRAIERNMIMPDKTRGWIYANGSKICTIPMDRWNRAIEVLLNKLINDEDAYNTFQATIGGIASDISMSANDIELITDENLKEYSKSKFPEKWWPPTTKPETIRNWLKSQYV